MRIRISRSRLAAGVARAGITMYLALLPLQWAILGEVGGRTIKPVHLAAFALVGAFLLMPNPVGALAAVTRRNLAVITALACYMGLQLASLGYLRSDAFALSIAFKYAAYAGLFVLIAAIAYRLPESDFERTAVWGSRIGILIFGGALAYVFHMLGRNIVLEYAGRIVRGDAAALQFGTYPVVFDYFNPAREFDAALRITLVGAFVLYAVLARLWTRRPFVFYGATVLVLTSVVRTHMLSLALMFALVGLVHVVRRRGRIHRPARAAAVAFAAMLALVVVAWNAPEYLSGASRVTVERFGNLADAPRVDLARVTIRRISERPFTGHGLGTVITERHGHAVHAHNFILGSWLELGMLGLAASVAVLASILVAWLRAARRALRSGWPLYARPAWLITLPVMPLLRSQIAGSGGAWSLIDWTALAIFFGLLTKIGYRCLPERRHD